MTTIYTTDEMTKALVKARTSMLMDALRINFPRVIFKGSTKKANDGFVFTVTFEGPVAPMSLAAVTETYETDFLTITQKGKSMEWI